MTEKAPSKAKATKPKADAGFNFERSIEQLETLVAAMEDGELSLEDSGQQPRRRIPHAVGREPYN